MSHAANKGTWLIGNASEAEEEVLGISSGTVDVYRSGAKMYSSEYTFGFPGLRHCIWPHLLRLVTNGNVGLVPRKKKDNGALAEEMSGYACGNGGEGGI